MNYELHHGDCLEVMRTLPDASVDCVLTDPPYGTTACKWDSVIPFEPMWKELKRIAKPKAAICLFGSQPFTSALVMSNPKMFRYEWIWEKSKCSNFMLSLNQPRKLHENVLVFASVGAAVYNPQFLVGRPYIDKRTLKVKNERMAMAYQVVRPVQNDGFRYPASVIIFDNEAQNVLHHPTQKPVELLRYLIRTYTNEGETVLDFTMGSGSTGVACELEGRKFIGIEKDDEYFRIATDRIEGVRKREPLFMEAAA